MNLTTKIEHMQARRDHLPQFSDKWCDQDDKIHEIVCNAAAKREAAWHEKYAEQIRNLDEATIRGAGFSDAIDLMLASEEDCTCHQDPDRSACSSCRARNVLRFDMPY